MEDLNPKHVLVEALKKQYHVEPIRGSDIVALNSKAILYVRYNKNAGGTKSLIGKFWFGITKSEYDTYSHQNLFIVCACVLGPDDTDYLVFPSDTFDEIKKDIVLQSGQWKFNLLKTNEKRYFLQIAQKGKYDVTEFLNYFDFSPREFRRTYAPSIREVQQKVVKKEPGAVPRETLSLEDELLVAAKDSANHKNFEAALERFFAELGFTCKRVGGPGETDILVLEPVRFIVDGKSTKGDAKSSINFTRIKRHMTENRAQFMVIVSVGFQPSVERDAELEGATLMDVQTAVTILRLQRENVLSPFDYVEVLRQPGITGSAKLDVLQQKIQHRKDILTKLLILLRSIDFTPRNVDEIKGRIDLYSEQRHTPKPDKKEIENLLNFLANDLLGVVSQRDNLYSSRFGLLLSKEKLKLTTRSLCGEVSN